MKFRNCLYCTLLAVLFVSFTACEKENEMEELTAEIPVAVKRDFNAKYPLATITSFHAYSDSLNEIEFVNDQRIKLLFGTIRMCGSLPIPRLTT